ncbi:unnamed protein product [Gongylonema pulchrum]|uniref:ATM interactor n=1 Tax=Gongylonema pulchrum TaxID=637853 RepID=A0A183EAC8_9BILA|nr:unnamed protein product [Gongylonema pulchrum]
MPVLVITEFVHASAFGFTKMALKVAAQNEEENMMEVQQNESMPGNIQLDPEECVQLQQQHRHSFDDNMNLVAVSVANGAPHRSSSNVEVEPAVDFGSSTLLDSDILDSSLISGTHMADSKFYGTGHTFSLSHSMEDVSTQGGVPALPPENLLGTEMSPSRILVPSDLFGSSILLDNSFGEQFPTESIITTPSNSAQHYSSSLYNSTICPELSDFKETSVPGNYSSLVVSSNPAVTLPDSPGFVRNKIHNVLDLETRNATLALTSVMESSSSTCSLNDCITPFFLEPHDTAIAGSADYNVSL